MLQSLGSCSRLHAVLTQRGEAEQGRRALAKCSRRFKSVAALPRLVHRNQVDAREPSEVVHSLHSSVRLASRLSPLLSALQLQPAPRWIFQRLIFFFAKSNDTCELRITASNSNSTCNKHTTKQGTSCRTGASLAPTSSTQQTTARKKNGKNRKSKIRRRHKPA